MQVCPEKLKKDGCASDTEVLHILDVTIITMFDIISVIRMIKVITISIIMIMLKVIGMKDMQMRSILKMVKSSVAEWDSCKCPPIK